MVVFLYVICISFRIFFYLLSTIICIVLFTTSDVTFLFLSFCFFFLRQVLFLMYHYFAATEIYNAIRVFIAAYVWMTGFGNFSYYYIKKDFSLARFTQVNS